MKKLSDKIGQFTTVPNSFIEQAAELSSPAFRLLVTLRYYTNSKTEVAFPSYATLRAITGLRREAISQAIKDLKAAGWIECRRRFGKSTVYALRYPHSSSDSGTTGKEGSSSDSGTISSSASGTISSPDGCDANQTEINQTECNQTEIGASAPPAPESPAPKPSPVPPKSRKRGDPIEAGLNWTTQHSPDVRKIKSATCSENAREMCLEVLRIAQVPVVNVKTWTAGGQALYEACGGDKSVIEAAYQRLRGGPKAVTVSDPWSLVNTAAAIVGERRNNPPKPAETGEYVEVTLPDGYTEWRRVS